MKELRIGKLYIRWGKPDAPVFWTSSIIKPDIDYLAVAGETLHRGDVARINSRGQIERIKCDNHVEQYEDLRNIK